MSLVNPTSESDVRRWLLAELRAGGCHAMAVENGGVGGGEGTPDVEAALNCRTAWVETKFFHQLPARVRASTHPLRLTDRQMRPAQRVWHTLRARAGSRSFYLIVLRSTLDLPEWYVLPGLDCAQHLGRTWTLDDMRLRNVLPTYTARPTSKELLRCLHLFP